jgi:ABC-type branched-subunit amino acid transport system permease subunit
MSQRRRVRELESQSRLPNILWAVLLIGGGITTLSCCLFGTANFKLHCVQVISLTLLLALALVAIADIDRPFQGSVHVNPSGFERARYTLQETAPTP